MFILKENVGKMMNLGSPEKEKEEVELKEEAFQLK